MRKWVSAAAAAAPCLLMMGCSRAPSVDILGSFFPVWMVCLTIAVVVTSLLRVLLVKTRMETEVGPLVLFYPCTVILIASMLWLILFR